jgi:hypothetical protein
MSGTASVTRRIWRVRRSEAAPPRTTATLDGAALPREAWGTALEVDPGVHALHVEGPSRVSFDRSVSVGEGASQTVTVSLLPRAEEGRPLDRPARVAGPTIAPRTWALATAGVGGGLVLVGLGFGAAAISQRHDACGPSGCDVAAYEHGRTLARTSDLITGLGVATLAGGVVWYLLAPRTAPGSSAPAGALLVPWASRDGAGLALARSF